MPRTLPILLAITLVALSAAPAGAQIGPDVIVGALVASAAEGSAVSKYLGLLAVVLASVNIFGGFAVTARMLAMYKKKDRPAPAKH